MKLLKTTATIIKHQIVALTSKQRSKLKDMGIEFQVSEKDDEN